MLYTFVAHGRGRESAENSKCKKKAIERWYAVQDKIIDLGKRERQKNQ